MSWQEAVNRETGKTVLIGEKPLECIREALKEVKKIYAALWNRTPTESELFSVVEAGLKEYMMNQDAFEIQDIRISVIKNE